MKLKVFTDGGSRGNPGISGLGVYITDSNDKQVEKRYKYLGEKTNNEAEYLGAYYGLMRAGELGATDVELYMDSKLVISQLSGEWKIKKPELKKIHSDIMSLIDRFGFSTKFLWIRREVNTEADRLSNVAMDKKE